MMRTILLLILSAILIQSCVVKERYHFNKDLSGSYYFEFDYSAFREFDSTLNMMDGIYDGYGSLKNELENIEGIHDVLILSDTTSSKIIMTYRFDDLNAINATYFDQETGTYSRFFKKEEKDFSFVIDMSDQLDDYTDPTMSKDELFENIHMLLDYSVQLNFDSKFKIIENTHFESVDKRSLLFELDSASLQSPSKLVLRMK